MATLKPEIIIRDVMLSRNLDTSIALGREVFMKLSEHTKRLYYNDSIESFKRAASTEIDTILFNKKITSTSVDNVFEHINEAMLNEAITVEQIAYKTRLSTTVVKSMLETKAGSIENVLAVLHVLGLDLKVQEWADKFPEESEPVVNESDFVNVRVIDEWVHERIQRTSLTDIPPLEALGANLSLEGSNILSDNVITISGEIHESKDSQSSMFYRYIPLVLEMSDSVIAKLIQDYSTSPNMKVFGHGDNLIILDDLLRSAMIYDEFEGIRTRRIVFLVPYNVSVVESIIVPKDMDLSFRLGGVVYNTTISLTNIQFIINEEGTDNGSEDGGEDPTGGDGSGNGDDSNSNETDNPEPVEPDGNEPVGGGETGEGNTETGGSDNDTTGTAETPTEPDVPGGTDGGVEEGQGTGGSETTEPVNPNENNDGTDGGESIGGETPTDNGTNEEPVGDGETVIPDSGVSGEGSETSNTDNGSEPEELPSNITPDTESNNPTTGD